MRTLGAAGDRVAPCDELRFELGACELFIRGADDQPAAGCDDFVEQVRDERASLRYRDVVEAGADVIEAARRCPLERVADEDAIGPLRKARTGAIGERRQD